jgi:hypothetical protein
VLKSAHRILNASSSVMVSKEEILKSATGKILQLKTAPLRDSVRAHMTCMSSRKRRKALAHLFNFRAERPKLKQIK